MPAAQRVVCFPAFSQVLDCSNQARPLPAQDGSELAGELDPALRPVASANAPEKRKRLAVLHGPRNRLPVSRQVAGMQEFVRESSRAERRLVRREPENPGDACVVPYRNIGHRVPGPDAQFRSLGSQPELFLTVPQQGLGAFDVIDVGAGAEPLLHHALRIEQWLAANQPPAIRPVGAPQPAFELVAFESLRHTLPGFPGALAVFGVKGQVPACSPAFVLRQAGVVAPLLIEIGVAAIGPGDPDDLRYGLRQRAKCRFVLELQFACLPEVVGSQNRYRGQRV